MKSPTIAITASTLDSDDDLGLEEWEEEEETMVFFLK